jgi:hypothetical protein
VDCDVIAAPNEQTETLATVDRIEETFGRKPEKMLAETGELGRTKIGNTAHLAANSAIWDNSNQ